LDLAILLASSIISLIASIMRPLSD
jgi:hypothetical protein